MILIRRLSIGTLVVVGAGVELMQFDSARSIGASVLASAGLLSIVVGLAAQTSLGNVFASIQLALTDALRVDDVVVVEGGWGNVEEIGLSAVVRIWDERRLVLPSTYFTTKPFQNWTRHTADVLGSVELDLDWNAPVRLMRDELGSLLDGHDLWDPKVGMLQVVDATGSFVRVRILISAKDGPTVAINLSFPTRTYTTPGGRQYNTGVARTV